MDRKPLSLFKRAFASILDKIFIIVLFLAFSLTFFGVYSTSGDLGTYSVVLEMNPANYEFIPNGSLTYEIDIRYTVLFIVTNGIYYFATMFYKASLGKRIVGGVYANINGSEASIGRYSLSCCILLLILVGLVIIRFFMGLTYWHVIILFFLVNDLPVLFTSRHASFVDILSSIFLVERKNGTNGRTDASFLVGNYIGKCIYSYKQGLNGE